MSIQEKAMLVKWTISSWGATKRDQENTDKLCTENQTTKEWLRANKSLLPDEALKPIHQVERQARDCHYRMTLPYDDDGWRILPSKLYPDYLATFNDLKEKDYELVRVLCDDLPRLKEQARKNLSTSYCEDDYPTAEELWDRFDMTMSVRPIPEGKALIVDINSGELDGLRTSIDSEVQTTIKQSMMDLWYRLRDGVSRAAQGFTDGKVIFSCWVDNIKELSNILPKLNITGDKDLASITEEVQQKLTTINIEAVRKDKTTRQQAASTAQKTLEKLDCLIQTRKIDLELE